MSDFGPIPTGVINTMPQGPNIKYGKLDGHPGFFLPSTGICNFQYAPEFLRPLVWPSNIAISIDAQRQIYPKTTDL